MQQQSIPKKIRTTIDNFQTTHQLSRTFILLFIFLIVVILVAYVVPFLDFGRFTGTDDYTHIFYTQVMDSSTSTYDFYSLMGARSSDPENPENSYNYPFALWLFGSFVSKITGLSVMTGNFIVLLFFFAAIIGTFYHYSGLFLSSKEQKIIAILFMLSMPNVAMILLNYRPSVFVLPFLLLILYFAFQSSVKLKYLPILWLSIFIVVIAHTGTFIFLIGFSLLFFLLYSLFWGKFSENMYITISSTFLIYVLTLSWFPEISNQYEAKSTLFLKPGNFLATKFNFSLVQELARIFYQNLVVGQQLIYALLFVVALYGTSQVLIYIHRKVSGFIGNKTHFPAFVLPIQNISHSIFASPIWLGPVHVLLTIPGFFRLDSKAKCIFIAVITTTFLPDLLYQSEGLDVATGALREISYLIIIIPIAATLGLWWVLSKVDALKNSFKIYITYIIWFVVLSVMILTPVLGSTYYIPRIAGEDYTISGMKWLGENGDHLEKISGFGYRTVPVFTGMAGPGYDQGSETRLYIQTLKNIHFSSANQVKNVNDFRQLFGVKYLLTSDKVLTNLGGKRADLKIDSNPGLNKMYSSRDLGIYEIISSAGDSIPEYSIAQNTTIKKYGSAYVVKSDAYKVVLNENNPIIDSIGTTQKNYFGPGYLVENFKINTPDKFYYFGLSSVQFSSVITDNQVSYKTELNANETSLGTLQVRYTFFPKIIMREYILSNDLLSGNTSSRLDARFSSALFSPLSNYIITNNKESQERQIFESMDTVEKTIKVEDIFIYNPNKQENSQKQGIFIKNVPTSPFPTLVTYKGSTKYDLSSVTITQSNSIDPGESLHITQYISTGDEYGTEERILSQNGIQLINYPDGITPLVIIGTGTSFSEDGYSILRNAGIPYSQVIRAVSPKSNKNTTENISDSENSSQSLESNNIRDLSNKGIGLIGSGKMTDVGYLNITSQEKIVESLEDYGNNQGVSVNGFMPLSFRYNLDTIKVLNDKNNSFMISNPANPPFNEGYRNPQMAYYNDKSTGIVILPVSYPTSSSLFAQTDSDEVFSSWRNTLKAGTENDEMIMFILNSADIGDPEFSDKFSDLFSYARNNSYTFSKPETVADYFRKLQNVKYSGFTDIDMASINITNNNDQMIQNVTFKVTLDKLNSGDYAINGGTIVKTKQDSNRTTIYISTDIPAHSTQNLMIQPNSEREQLDVQIPDFVSEGSMKIAVKDQNARPLKDVDVIIDANFYKTDRDGIVNLNLHRGTYNIIVQHSGYKKYVKTIEVKGKLANFQQVFEKYFKNS
jgi:hypothetical protein